SVLTAYLLLQRDAGDLIHRDGNRRRGQSDAVVGAIIDLRAVDHAGADGVVDGVQLVHLYVVVRGERGQQVPAHQGDERPVGVSGVDAAGVEVVQPLLRGLTVAEAPLRQQAAGEQGDVVSAHGSSPPRRPDRKSTRLNSSHVKISYAVFCLKKKKK